MRYSASQRRCQRPRLPFGMGHALPRLALWLAKEAATCRAVGGWVANRIRTQYAIIIVAMQLACMGPSRKREGILGMQSATGQVTGQQTSVCLAHVMTKPPFGTDRFRDAGGFGAARADAYGDCLFASDGRLPGESTASRQHPDPTTSSRERTPSGRTPCPPSRARGTRLGCDHPSPPWREIPNVPNWVLVGKDSEKKKMCSENNK